MQGYEMFLAGGVLFLLVAHWFSSGANKRGMSCGYLFVAAILIALLVLGLGAASRIGQ